IPFRKRFTSTYARTCAPKSRPLRKRATASARRSATPGGSFSSEVLIIALLSATCLSTVPPGAGPGQSRSARTAGASGPAVRGPAPVGLKERGGPMSISSPHPRPTTQEIRHALSHASFAVLSHVTPAGAPRSSGVVYTMSGDRMYVVVAEDSWKARHIAANCIVAVTVPIRRGGLLSLLFPIPPATVSFPAVAV